MASGIGIEMEEMGAVALIGLILTPGMFWIGSAKSTASRIGRVAIVAGLVGAAMALELTLDRTANSVVDKVSGGA